MAKTRELKVREKHAAASPSEPTEQELIFTPDADIFETDQEIMLFADMPGVQADDVTIDIHDKTLTLTGAVRPWEGPDEADVRIEFEIGTYRRQFTLANRIVQDQIRATMKDGVLKLTLPKAEKARPRKIRIQNA